MGKEVIKIIKKFLNSLLEVIYPYENKCVICDEDNFLGICPYCKSKIKRAKGNDGMVSYGYYGGVLKQLILLFKYKKNFTAGKVLSDFLLDLIDELDLKVDYICYVPMTKKEKMGRGYNQCEVLAKSIGESIGVEVSHCLKKVRQTKEQKKLNKVDRSTNVIGAFIAKGEEVKGKNILLIDDVITTGATINQCIKILKDYGVKKINILTIAKSNI